MFSNVLRASLQLLLFKVGQGHSEVNDAFFLAFACQEIDVFVEKYCNIQNISIANIV